MQGKCFGYGLIYGLAAVFAFTDAALAAQKKPSTAVELALYTGADRQQILEEGARKEGKLTVYTVGIPQAVNPKVAAFQKKYPFVKVETWRATTNQLLSKVTEEYASGSHTADILEIAQGAELAMEERGGMLQPFSSPNLVSIEEDAVRKAGTGGAFAAGIYENSYSLGYNTKLIGKAELPKTHQDLMDPRWKGKIALNADNLGVSWFGMLLDTYGEDFVKRMARQNFSLHTVVSMGILNMIANGEYPLSPTIAGSHVSESKKKGAPVGWQPLEPVHVSLGQIALAKYPASPHAALLYLDFNLSKETGELYKAAGYESPRKDLAGELAYKKYYGPFSTKQFAQWNKLFNQLFLKR